MQGVRLVNQIETAEVDGDPQAELLILQNRLGQITIQVYEIVQGALRTKGLSTQVSTSPTALWFIRDLDGDGKVEIIMRTIRANRRARCAGLCCRRIMDSFRKSRGINSDFLSRRRWGVLRWKHGAG